MGVFLLLLPLLFPDPQEVRIRLRDGGEHVGTLEAVRDGFYILNVNGAQVRIAESRVRSVDLLPRDEPPPDPVPADEGELEENLWQRIDRGDFVGARSALEEWRGEFEDQHERIRRLEQMLWDRAIDTIDHGTDGTQVIEAMRWILRERTDENKLEAARAAVARIAREAQAFPAESLTERLMLGVTELVQADPVVDRAEGGRLSAVWWAWIDRLSELGAWRSANRALTALPAYFRNESSAASVRRRSLRLEWAERLVGEGEFDLARTQLEPVLNADPRDPDACRLLARVEDAEERHRILQSEPARAMIWLGTYLEGRADEASRRWAFENGWNIVDRASVASSPSGPACDLVRAYIDLQPTDPWLTLANRRLREVTDRHTLETLAASTPLDQLRRVGEILSGAPDDDMRHRAYRAGWSAIETELTDADLVRAMECLDRYLGWNPPEPWRTAAHQRVEATLSDPPGAETPEEHLAMVSEYLATAPVEEHRRMALEGVFETLRRATGAGMETPRAILLLESFLEMEPEDPARRDAAAYLNNLRRQGSGPRPAPAPAVPDGGAPQVGQGDSTPIVLPPAVAEFFPAAAGSWFRYRLGGGGEVRVEYSRAERIGDEIVVTQVSRPDGAREWTDRLVFTDEAVAQEIGGQREVLLQRPFEAGREWTSESGRVQARRRVVNVDETITLSDGRAFEHCLVVEHITEAPGAGGESVEIRSASAYAPGVGLIRLQYERSEFQVYDLELVEYHLP